MPADLGRGDLSLTDAEPEQSVLEQLRQRTVGVVQQPFVPDRTDHSTYLRILTLCRLCQHKRKDYRLTVVDQLR